MTISAVSPTQNDPLYHATLTDGTTTVGLKFVNADGGKNKRAISKDALNRYGLQMVQGNLSYSSLKEPYTAETQVDWSGGRGLNHFHKDKSRFYDSNRANTWRPGQISLGPRETYGYGHRSQEFYLPGSVTWKSLTGTERFIASSVLATSTDDRVAVYFWVRRVGTPGTLTVRLRNNTTSAPGTTTYQTVTATTTNITDLLSVLYRFEFAASGVDYTTTGLSFTAGATDEIHDVADQFVVEGFAIGDTFLVEDSTYNDGTYVIETVDADQIHVTGNISTAESAGANITITKVQGVTSGTTYWVEIAGASTDTATNHWEVAVDAAAGNADSTTKYSTAGTTTWSTASYDMYYRLVDYDGFHPPLQFFEYKKQWYCFTEPSGGAPKIFMQGDRGVCLGTQHPKQIVDTAKAWTTDEWIGCIVLISDGTGSTFLRPWRRITSNTATALSFTAGRWGRLPVAGDTEYVILNSDQWTEITGHGITVPITDVCVADKVVYFALGNGNAIRKMNERVVTKTYTANTISFDVKADPTLDEILDSESELDKFLTGDIIVVTGSTSNNGTYTVSTGGVGAKIVVAEALGLDEIAGDKVKIVTTPAYTYVRRFRDDGSNKAYFLKAIRSPTKGFQVWKAMNKGNQGGPSLCVANATNFLKSLPYPVLVTDCETEWTSADADVVSALTYFNQAVNNAAVELTIAATPGAVLLAYHDLGATATIDIRDKKKLRLWIFSTIAWTKSSTTGLKIRLSADSDCSSSDKDVLLPDISPNQWHLLEIPYTADGATDWAALSAMRTIGLVAINNPTAACKIRLDTIELVPAESDIPLGDDDDLITGMEAYGDPQIPWLFRQGSVGYVLNGVYHELPLPEMKNSPTNRNGLAHCVTSSPGPYLYWSYLSGVNRYYRNNIDSVGPNLDDGLPEDRTGSVSSLFAYPGCVYESVYADTDGYSSLLKLIGTSTHEAYRCNDPGKRIGNIALQVIPGFVQDKLWFDQDGDPVWIYVPSNTLREETDTSYKYTQEGSVETGWIYLSMFDASKFFNSLKNITRLASASMPILVDYKTDEATTWSTLSTSYTTSPSQEVSFNTTVPGTTGKRIKLRFRLYSNSVTATPYLEAWVMECLTIVVPKWSYTFQFLVADEASDIEGDETADRAETLTNQLETWAASPGSLTFNTIFSPMDSKTVRIAPYSLRPVRASPDEQLEGHVSQITLIEL